MSSRPLRRGVFIILAGVMLTSSFLGARPARALPWLDRTSFASPRFGQVWGSADEDVANGRATRSWTWGPSPWFDYYEFYKQSPNGLRLVQYFDKARMELTDPATTSGPLGGVTNGLLPVEMVSGRIKLGDGIGPDQYEQHEPAGIPVAGDPLNENPNAPTYGSFQSVATTDNGYRDPNRLGRRVGTTLARDGATGFRQDLADLPGTEIVAYEPVTGHNVPRVFDDFRQAGPVAPIAAFGQPITDAYWIVARLGTQGVQPGQDRDMLVQLFERRVITYTPSNPPAFQVEMGNVGQHYFQWRYPALGGLGQPWQLPVPPFYAFEGILFASRRESSEFTMYKMEADGTRQFAFDQPSDETDYATAPFSLLRSWDLDGDLVFGDSTRFTPSTAKRQIVSQRYTYAPLPHPSYRLQHVIESAADDHHPAVSPDGKKIAFASDRDGSVELYLVNRPDDETTVRTIPAQLTQTAGCSNEFPDWLPDGSGLVFASNCLDGIWDIYLARLDYTQDKPGELQVGRLLSPGEPGVTRLTHSPAPDIFPRVSPDGQSIAFDGNGQIYTLALDGGRPRRLTADSTNTTPAWSGDGKQIAFSSMRDGELEIFVMRSDGSAERRLTDNAADDGFPIWAQ